jgi:HK97 family phage prohead protease/HK97 family phage major capsid protein
MVDKTKILYLNSAFTKELPTAGEDIESIYIEGYASTNDVDRMGDVVPVSVWEAGIKNYLKNPIILAQHDHDDPIGRMTEHKLDKKGLWIKARISAAAEVFNLVKDGVLTAFSIGFRVLDAEYNAAAELFVIKELELIEISVVSVPCNQNTLFNLSKSFENEEDYTKFKAQFAPTGESAKGLESPTGNKSTPTKKEWNMDPKELEIMLAKAATDAANAATKALLDAQAAEKAAAAAKAVADAEFDVRVKAAVAAQVSVGESGAEKLLKDIEKRFEDQTATSTKMLADLQGTIAEKAAELTALQNSKMQFGGASKAAVEYTDREKAVLLAKIKGVELNGTKFGRDMIEKAGAHVPGAIPWELEVSLSMENEIRRKLVVASLITPIAMKTNVMTMPVNPEAGFATWVTNAQFGTTASTGAAQTHQLKEITLNAYKVATAEYMAYEEEEDSLLALLPIVRDAMVRRVAKAVDLAFLRGAGTGGDPVKGFAIYDATSAVTPTNTGVATIANLRALRQDLGVWGLTQSEMVYVVSTDIYYNLLDDTLFQTMDKVGTQATLLTGQIGMIGQTPVIVSDAFPAKAGGAATASTNIGAICVAAANFIAGNQRGLRMDTQDLVETQRRVMVASLRTGMTQLSTVNGMGISTLRWS